MAKRLFFALWPGEAQRQALLTAAQPFIDKNARAQSAQNLHITLAFLGSIESAQQRCLEQQAAAVHVPAFELNIDRIDFWARQHILWAGSSVRCEALFQLAAQLTEGIRACGLVPEQRTYQPHITLARQQVQGPKQAQDIAPINWAATEFVLAESVHAQNGVVYRPLKHWPLAFH